jgi:hypothetical protein
MKRLATLAAVLAVCTSTWSATDASAADNDQAAWAYIFQSSCSSYPGYVHFSRSYPSCGNLNSTAERDGNLRDSSSTYYNGYYIGNLSGGATNTKLIGNSFGSTNIKWFGTTCYGSSSAGITINAGSSGVPSTTANLRSYAKVGVTGCGQN